MTKQAYDNRDKPFSDWLRKHPCLESRLESLDITDIDFIFHKYKTHIDRLGTREVRLMFNLEVKCYGKLPSENQLESSYITHQLLNKKEMLLSNLTNKQVTVWHFGVYHLIIYGGVRPDSCVNMEWGVFNQGGRLSRRQIDEKTLVKLLSFEIRPDNQLKVNLRRHHKTTVIYQVEKSPLCFPMVERVRS